jgi:hypothetical protein
VTFRCRLDGTVTTFKKAGAKQGASSSLYRICVDTPKNIGQCNELTPSNRLKKMKSNLPRSVLLFFLVFFSAVAGFGQGSRQLSPYDTIEEKDRDNPEARAAWFLRGRTAPPGQSAALLRFRAYQQKLQIRKLRMASPRAAAAAITLTGGWAPLGPSPLASDAGNGQDYNWVSGRATAVAIDPADTTGNTVYVGGAHAGVWKSTNAGTPLTSSVHWAPVLDYESTLAVGSIAIQPNNNDPTKSVILVGTGEPNSSADSYYGLGILRSADAGNTWTLVQSAATGQSFAGMGFSKIAFSMANSNLVVAAAGTASKGIDEGLQTAATYPANLGVYYSTNGGVSWSFASIKDGATTIAPGSVTSVVYNTSVAKFFAAIRRHGIYSSSDGVNWMRLTSQPGAGLTTANCPANPSSANCPIYRAELTVVPGRNEMYTWVVSLSSSGSEADGGIWQSLNGGSSWTQISDTGITNCGDPGGCGVSQGTYNLELLASPNGSATNLYAGAINLYRCTINNPSSPSCTFLNLTHVYGCVSIAHVHPDQHHLASIIASGKELMYFANDGGIYRALDGYTGLTTGTCGGTNQFDSLNQTLGSMTQFVSFSVHPTDSQTMLGGTQDNGSPATSSASPANQQWGNVHAGDGGYNAITSNSPNDWFTSYPDIPPASLEIDYCGSGSNCNAGLFNQVIGSVNLGNDDGEFYFPYTLDPQAPAELLVGTCRIWRVDNAKNPTKFTALSPDFEPGGTTPCSGGEINLVRSIAAGGPKDANGFSKVIYAGTDGLGPLAGTGITPTGGRVFVTTDASVATPVFTEVTGNINPSHYPVSDIAIDTSDATGQTAYVTIMGFGVSHVWKTTNAGGSWTDFTGTGLQDSPANSVIVDSGVVYVGTDVGVFYGSTSSPSWSEVGPAPAVSANGYLPNVPVSALRIFSSGSQKLLRASTYGRGIWQFGLSADYQIAVSNSPQTIFPGQTATFNGTLTSMGGYNSAVTLTCTAGSTSPPTTCTPPAPVTPTTGGAAFAVSTGGSVGTYSFNIHGVGADAAHIAHDAPVVLQVVDFAIGTPSPASVSVVQGNTAQGVVFQVTASGSFNGTVNLSCAGLPTNASCSFSPSAAVQPRSGAPVSVTLLVSTQTSTPTGTKTVTISTSTTGALAAKTQTLSLTVTAPVPDYSLTFSSSTQTASINSAATFQGKLTAANGYASPVNLSCGAGAPPTCTFSPNSVTPTVAGASFTLTTQSNAANSYTFLVNGTGTDAAHIAHSASVTFNSFNFSLSDTPSSQTVVAGQTATYNLTVTPMGLSTFPNNVTFACSGTLPGSTSCSFNPTQVAANASGPQSVTLSIVTAGLGAPAPVHPVANEWRGLPLFLWIPAVGLVIGRLTRKPQVRRKGMTCLILIFLIAAMTTLPSCGGGSSSGGGGGGGGGVTVRVTPPTVNLVPTQKQQFTASVTGSSNTAVSWTVNGITAGSSAIGSIDATGLYTAPGAVPNPATVTIAAVAQADITKSSSASVTIVPATPSGTYPITVTAISGSITQSVPVTLVVQ